MHFTGLLMVATEHSRRTQFLMFIFGTKVLISKSPRKEGTPVGEQSGMDMVMEVGWDLSTSYSPTLPLAGSAGMGCPGQ